MYTWYSSEPHSWQAMSENHAVNSSDRGIDKQLIVRLPDMDCSVSYNITAFPSWQFFVNFPGQKELENDLTPVAAMWNLLGVQLGINPDTLRGIGSTSHLCAVRFQKTMNELVEECWWAKNMETNYWSPGILSCTTNGCSSHSVRFGIVLLDYYIHIVSHHHCKED